MTPIKDRLGLLTVPWPVLLVAGLFVVALLAFAGAYGFHGDEMYFVVAGQHPAFGYVDQPPLTPLLSAVSVALLGVSPTAVRLLPYTTRCFRGSYAAGQSLINHRFALADGRRVGF